MKGQALKKINEAKNACGERAAQCSGREDFYAMRGWQAIAAELTRLEREAAATLAAEKQ